MDFRMNTTGLIVAGLATPLIVGLVAARVTLWARRRSFERSKTHGEFRSYAQLDLPAVVRAPHELQLLEAFTAIADTEHQSAKHLQDVCISYLVSASAALFTAFLCTALGATLLKQVEAWHTYGDTVDVTALIMVLGAFLRTRVLRLEWLRARIVAELVRQWGAVEGVFASLPNFTAKLDEFLHFVRTGTAADPDPSVVGQALADDRLNCIAHALGTVTISTSTQLRLYVQARPIRQAKWFARSISRIESLQSNREVVMVFLFVVALVAALVKFGVAIDRKSVV